MGLEDGLGVLEGRVEELDETDTREVFVPAFVGKEDRDIVTERVEVCVLVAERVIVADRVEVGLCGADLVTVCVRVAVCVCPGVFVADGDLVDV